MTPRARREGGPWLAVTQIVSGLATELECVESWEAAQSSSGPQRDFSEGELRCTMQGPSAFCSQAKKEGGLWTQFGPIQGTSQIDERGAKQGGL